MPILTPAEGCQFHVMGITIVTSLHGEEQWYPPPYRTRANPTQMTEAESFQSAEPVGPTGFGPPANYRADSRLSGQDDSASVHERRQPTSPGGGVNHQTIHRRKRGSQHSETLPIEAAVWNITAIVVE